VFFRLTTQIKCVVFRISTPIGFPGASAPAGVSKRRAPKAHPPSAGRKLTTTAASAEPDPAAVAPAEQNSTERSQKRWATAENGRVVGACASGRILDT